MAVVAKKLYGGTLTTNLSTTLYTATAVTAVVTSVTICNTSASSAALTLKLGGVTLYAAVTVPAGATWTLGPNDIRQVVEVSETITGGASAGSAIEVRISGTEVS